MKLKYTLLKNEATQQLVIKEYGELDKEVMSLLCEEAFDNDLIDAAFGEGKAALISALRSNNLFPPSMHSEKIADAVASLFAQKDRKSLDLLFDDKELLVKGQPRDIFEDNKDDADVDGEDEPDDLDDLDDLLAEDDLQMKSKTSAIKIADDESVDIEDES